MAVNPSSTSSPMVPGSWADSPIPLITTTKYREHTDIPPGHACIYVAKEMAAVHNILLRALNASYNQACQVKAGTPQAVDFIIFNQCIDESIHIHHESEEHFFFPILEKLTGIAGFCEVNLEQHRVFTAHVEAFKDYVHSVTPEEYDGQKLRDLINAFALPLAQHLTDEIQTLLRLKDYDSKKVGKAIDDTRKKALGTLGPYRHLPLVLICQDAAFKLDDEPFMIDIPWFLPYLVKYYYSRTHAGTWQFGPCDFWGRRRELGLS